MVRFEDGTLIGLLPVALVEQTVFIITSQWFKLCVMHNSECKISVFGSSKFRAGARVIGLVLIAIMVYLATLIDC